MKNFSRFVATSAMASALASGLPLRVEAQHAPETPSAPARVRTNAPNEKAWTPQVSVGVRYLAYSSNSPQAWIGTGSEDTVEWSRSAASRTQGVFWSPDRKMFFFISYHGDLATDRIVSTLHLFRAQDIQRSLAQGASAEPYATLTLAGDSKGGSGILSARWTLDNNHIQFASPGHGGSVRGFALSIKDKIVNQVIPDSITESASASLTEYRYSPRTSLACFQYDGLKKREGLYPGQYYQHRDEHVNLPAENELDLRQECFVIHAEKITSLGDVFDLSLSPGGDVFSFRKRGEQKLGFYSFDGNGGIRSDFRLAAPSGTAPEVWSPDGAFFTLSGTCQETPKADLSASCSKKGILVDSRTGITVREFDLPATPVTGEFTSASQFIVSAGPLPIAAFKLAGSNWQYIAPKRSSATRARNDRGLKVEFVQDVNTPPNVVASFGGHALQLLPDDPALKDVVVSRSIPFVWTEPDGRQMTGGLTLPSGFRPGQPIPVVIQPYYYLPERFLPDGQSRSGDAAQALAARGIGVLTINSMDLTNAIDGRSVMEGPQFVERIDAIVDELAKQGFSDPNRIGLLGFSRGGYQTIYSITHPERTPIAAAIALDAWTGSFPQYIEGSFGQTLSKRDFWHNRDFWLEADPIFNADRVVSPTLFTENGRITGRSDSLAMIGAFRMTHRPLEYLYFPYGIHHLARPREREAAMEASTDWMSFWLLGFQDSSPAKTEQYRRWNALRADWDKNRPGASAGSLRFGISPSRVLYSITQRTNDRRLKVGDRVVLNYAEVSLKDGVAPLSPSRKLEITMPVRGAAFGVVATGTEAPELLTIPGFGDLLRLLRYGERVVVVVPSVAGSDQSERAYEVTVGEVGH